MTTKVFYGGAIQGNQDRRTRCYVHQHLIEAVKQAGGHVLTEHTTGANYEEAAHLLTQSIGQLPPPGKARTMYVRNKMIDFVEGDIDAAVFEVSTPSLGTGIEIAHAYLRPRMGLDAIPILALYQKDYWPHHLSTMIQGLSVENYPNFTWLEYDTLETACCCVKDFVGVVSHNSESMGVKDVTEYVA